MDTVQPELQNKPNDLKQFGKEKTFRQKIKLDTVQQSSGKKQMN